ncbi:hypothetical protein V6N13_118350 [Hibiscus sabdariffa]
MGDCASFRKALYGSHKKDIAFELWFSTVRILTYVVHRLVVEKDVSAASPRGKVYIVGAALRGNVQKPPKVWIYGKDKIVLGPLFLFLVVWCAGFSIETIQIHYEGGACLLSELSQGYNLWTLFGADGFPSLGLFMFS